jgi:pyruvate,water dikinase
MNDLVIPLKAVWQSDAAQIGNKAATLGTLLAAEFPVPPGLCITTEAFRLALASRRNQIDAIIRQHHLSDPGAAKDAARAIADLLAGLAVPGEVWTAVRELLPSIADKKKPLAVRSSATAEDRPDISFAGQYDSIIGVCGEEALIAAIVKCWQSFFSTHALAARAAAHALGDTEAMAVLIQPVIEAECAGVCFSVDPVQRRADLAVVNAAWGLGVGVVDGAVATDTYWVHRRKMRLEERRVVEKVEQVTLEPTGSLKYTPTPEERRHAACLPEPWLMRIVQFSIATEAVLGYPQDVEWAIVDQQVWLLQSRPVTALPPGLTHNSIFPVTWEDEAEKRRLWMLAPVCLDKPFTPLEIDYYLKGIEAYNEVNYFAAFSEQSLEVKPINGYLYYRPIPLDLGSGDRRIRQAFMEDLALRLRQEGKTLWDHWGAEVITAIERLRSFETEGADGLKLAEHLENAVAAYRRHYVVHWLLWRTPIKALYTAYAKVTGLSEAEAESAASQLLEGEETSLTQLVEGLYRLGQSARKIPAVAALMANSPPDLFKQLKALPEAADFCAEFEAFLKIFGDRTGKGFGSDSSFLTPTWSEEPALVLRLAAPYLDPAIEAPSSARVRAMKMREAQVEAICQVCEDKEAVAEFRRQLAYARREATVLEEHNHYIDQATEGQLRRAVLLAAGWLAGQKSIAKQDDVFWLTVNEILAALRSEVDSLMGIIAERKVRYAELLKLEPPPILGVPDAKLPQRPPLTEEITTETPGTSGRLIGQGASPGRYYGRAHVVRDPLPLPELWPGEVLVAENVGPAWTPFIPVLGGLVLDGGSLGQHAAATAREYGIPAVIQTKIATRHIPHGAWITVDGMTGVVEMGEAG